MADDASVPLQHSQYIQIDCDFTLLQIGTRASGFADCPAALRLGEDARLAFPELIGLENSLAAIGTAEYATLTLEGIARFSDGENPFYLDIWIERCCHDRDRYWVGFEDSTQRTLVKQAILHHANATEILIAQLSASQKYIATAQSRFTSTQSIKPKAERVYNARPSRARDRGIAARFFPHWLGRIRVKNG
jgi:hypothetical protein